jgi:hypothetical protein
MSREGVVRNTGLWFGLVAAAVGLGCAAPGIDFDTSPGSTTPDGLRRVRWSPLGSEFLKPGADLRGYTGILIDPVAISYQTQHGQGLDPRVSPYAPEQSQLDHLQRAYQESFRRALTRGGLTPATAPGPGVLRLSGRIADLTVLAPPTDTLDPDETVYSSSAGDLTLLLDLTDAATGSQLLRAGGRHSISIDPVIGGEEDDPVINAAAVSELFDQQALILHQRIEQLRQTPAPPAP